MKGYLRTYDGREYELPTLLQWEVDLTGSVPCDSFSVSCAYDPAMLAVLPDVTRFYAVQEGQRVFFGVVDEYIAAKNRQGRTLTLTGRGMAALLVDNESEAMSYESADLREIFRNHAAPYGFSCGTMDALRGTKYVVESGSSQWKALSRFTEYYGGFSPRFTPTGELILSAGAEGKRLKIGEDAPVLALSYTENRYGVFSEVLVKDKARGASLLVENEELKRRGGSCRRVIYMPRKSSYAAMRYTGEYQIMKSKEEQLQIELQLPGAFLAVPGDVVRLSLSDCGISGEFRVSEAESRGGETGELCTLLLTER
ncbi:MAG: hypothetical protein ACI3W8_05800 [Oscillospiraceae bacterium]